MGKVYQPMGYADDGVAISYGSIPKGLHSSDAFKSREDCERWLDYNGYMPGEWAIIEFDEKEIKHLMII